MTGSTGTNFGLLNGRPLNTLTEFLFNAPPFLPGGVKVALSVTGSEDGVVDGLKSESMSCGREERGRPLPTVRTESRRGICFVCVFLIDSRAGLPGAVGDGSQGLATVG